MIRRRDEFVPGRRLGVVMGGVTVAVLGVCLFYGYVFLVQTPYSGIWLHGSWRVEAVDAAGVSAGLIRPGDQILAIGNLTHSEVVIDRRRVPFAGYRPGDRVPIRRVRDGREQTIEWPMVGPTFRAVVQRLTFLVPVFLLWLMGSVAWLILRPRGETWAVLILFLYVTAVWLALGPMSVYCTAWSSLMFHGVTWLMAPVYLHLHLVVPSPLPSARRRRQFLPFLYGAAFVLAVLELFQALPFTAYFLGFVAAVLGSLSLLVFRWWVRRAPVERQAVRLMATGVVLALGPLLTLQSGYLLGLHEYVRLPTMIVFVLVVPVLPMFYAYAVFKRYLGSLEFRANRLLGFYSFGLVYVTVYTLVLLPARWWLNASAGMLLYSLGTSAVFVLAAPALQARFQRWFNRLAYGARHDPLSLLILFSQQIPTARDRVALIHMLADEMMPALLIRQSALYTWGPGGYGLVYARGLTLDEKLALPDRIPGLLADAGRYRPPFSGTPDEGNWVRLVVPLKVQDRQVGVWLFGRRDPDDFYPQPDIDLLMALAGLVAIALENTGLYGELSRRAHQYQELYERARFTQFAVDHTPDAAFWLDARGRVIYANWAAVRLLGEDREDVLGRRFRDLPLEVPAVDWQAFHDALAARGTARLEVLYRASDGRVVPLELTANRVTFGQQRYDCIFARDITDRRAAEAAIRQLLAQTQEQAEWMREILDTVSEGIVLLDGQRRVLRTNPPGEAYLAQLAGVGIGAVLTRLGGRPIEDLLKPPGREGLAHEVETTGPPRRVFEVDARPIRRVEGGWVLVLRDVTERREIQERVQAQERLASIGQLAAGIAHDFNNLLMGMMGFAELLRERPDLPDPAREWTDTILEQGRRAVQLVRQVLDFSRKSLMEKRPVELVAFLNEMTKLFQRTLAGSVEVVLEYEAGEYWIQGDPARLQQILMNLVLNARDAMPQGGRLTIRLGRLRLDDSTRVPYPDMHPGEWVRLEVADTGTGIPPDVLPRIFEPFFTTKERGRGTGLGLAQVYGLVRQHDGFIDVRSQVGVGTTFIIYLPALHPETAAPPAPPAETVPMGGGELLLLVEDEDSVREVLQAMLERLGYRVAAAASGPEAVRLYERHRDEIALVVSDMVMPGMDGLALLQALRAIDPYVRMVLVTGHPLGEELRDFLQRGIVGWVQKPVRLTDLARLVRQALSAGPTPRVIDFHIRKAT